MIEFIAFFVWIQYKKISIKGNHKGLPLQEMYLTQKGNAIVQRGALWKAFPNGIWEREKNGIWERENEKMIAFQSIGEKIYDSIHYRKSEQ